jgi:hypothetical protein
VLASAQNGQCYANFARRYGIDEIQAAEASYFLIKSLLPAFDRWISELDGMQQFLASLSRDGFERILVEPEAFSDRMLRDRGGHIVAVLAGIAAPEAGCVRAAGAAAGVSLEMLGRMLPHVGVLLMAALHRKCEQPLRDVLANLRGSNAYAASVRDPFAALHAVLAGQARQQGPVRRLLAGVLGRDTVAPQQARAAATG